MEMSVFTTNIKHIENTLNVHVCVCVCIYIYDKRISYHSEG